LHQGETYLVADLDLSKGVATLLPHIEAYYTQARSTTEVEVTAREFELHGVAVGRVRVATSYGSYVKKRYFSEAVLDERPLDLPEVAYPTQALWFGVSHVAQAVPAALLPSAMHALEHTLIGLLPAFVLCERADVGGVSYPRHPVLGEPLIFIYDGYPGGVGYARAGATVFPEWLSAARELLERCPCQHGCPRCVLSPKCGNGNQFLDKRSALGLAEALLEAQARAPRVLS
jgi:DEAD/DEAH box helicase domain-containing protein